MLGQKVGVFNVLRTAKNVCLILSKIDLTVQNARSNYKLIFRNYGLDEGSCTQCGQYCAICERVV